MQSLAEKSYDYIYRKLSQGEFSPGDRLVNRNLASEIGVSVIPVREAIHRLASEGLVEYVPGNGAFVRQLSWQDLYELYVLRDALESCAAEEAAKRATEDQLERLGSIVVEMEEIHRQIEETYDKHATAELLNSWLDCEKEFHEVLIDAAQNKLLSKVVHDYRAVNQVFDAQRNDPNILTSDVARVTCRDRRRFLQALWNRDAALSRQLMSEQIQLGKKTVLNHMRSNQGSVIPS